MLTSPKTPNGYVFHIRDLELNEKLAGALRDLDAFLGPFTGLPGNNALEIYEIDGGWSAAWTHVLTDEFIHQDGSWIDQTA